MANIICRGVDQGRLIEVSVGSGFDDELRDRIWAERDTMPGMIVEIKADAVTQARDSDTYSLRFPRFLGFRGLKPGEKI
jgi:DNA ligase-1